MHGKLGSKSVNLQFVTGRVLDESNPASTLAAGILTVSQVARLHVDFYAPLAAADICGLLRPLLAADDAVVRARSCNLVGNLCRHSPAFYRPLQRSQLLPMLVQRCGDPDRATRKFACFALGNAGNLLDFQTKPCRVRWHSRSLAAYSAAQHILPSAT